MIATSALHASLVRAFPRYDWRGGVIMTAVAAGAMVMSCVPRMAQALSFHRFADARGWLGIANFMDVVTNAPFAAAAAVGLWNLRRRVRAERACVGGDDVTGRARLVPVDRLCLGAVFVGIGLTSMGSAYYHLAPGNERLFWDRLPMVLTFASLLATLVAERVSPRTGAWLLGVLPALGAASLVYWERTERAGAGDLRAYFLMEGATLASVLLVVLMYRARYLPTRSLMAGLACYGGAVVFEQLDRAVWSMWGSGRRGRERAHDQAPVRGDGGDGAGAGDRGGRR
jgi:hypothetical protein